MNRTLTRISVCCVTGLTLLISACSGTEPGEPTPGSTTGGTAPTTTSAASDSNALADVKPCDLLTDAEVTGLGLKNPGEADRTGGTETCNWLQGGGNGGVLVGIRPEEGFADLDYEGRKTEPIEVGKYNATKIEAPLGGAYGCDVVISVTESSSVQVVGTISATSTDTAAACKRATDAAELIAPKLP